MFEATPESETLQHEGISPEEMREWNLAKRQLVITSALRGAVRFAQQQPDVDMSEVAMAVESLIENKDLDPVVRAEAAETLQLIAERASL